MNLQVLSQIHVFQLREKVRQFVRRKGIDVILAVGGGSVIDCVKLIASAAKYDGDAWDFVSKKSIPKDALPFGTVLTLAATGSEMNAGSVITNEETQEKYGWGGPFNFPKFSILDPTYTLSVPKDQTIYGIVDMMSHIFEQYFNNATNTPVQDEMCEGVLRAIMENGPKLVEDLENYDLTGNNFIRRYNSIEWLPSNGLSRGLGNS